MKYDKVEKWVFTQEKKIRYRNVEYLDWDGIICYDIEFQIFKRPYFWGLIGHKKWLWSITTNDMQMGLEFSLSLI